MKGIDALVDVKMWHSTNPTLKGGVSAMPLHHQCITYDCSMVTNLTEYKSHITLVREFTSLSTK